MSCCRPYADESWERIKPERQREIESFLKDARERSEEVIWLAYLNLRERFELVRELELGATLGLDLGTKQDHQLVTAVRNAIAHGRPVESGTMVIEALAVSERFSTRLQPRKCDRSVPDRASPTTPEAT